MKSEKNIIHYFALLLLAGMTLFLIFSFLLTRYTNLSFPNGDFMFSPVDVLMDFFNVNDMVKNMDPYIGSGSSYPPFILLIAKIISLFLPHNSLSSFEVRHLIIGKIIYSVLFFGITIIIFILVFKAICKNAKTTFVDTFIYSCAFVFTAPYLFLLDRGNYLILAVLCYILALLNYEKKPFISSIFLALTISIKIYPLLTLLIPLLEKKWKYICTVCCIITFVSIFPILFFQGGFVENIVAFLKNLLGFSASNTSSYFSSLYYTVGLSSLIRFPTYFLNFENMQSTSFTTLYIIGFILTFIFVCISLKLEHILWRKWLIITFAIIFLTPNSYLYNLTLILAPIMLFFYEKKINKTDYIQVIIISLILIPKAYFYFEQAPACISIQDVINPILIIISLLTIGIENICKGLRRKVKM